MKIAKSELPKDSVLNSKEQKFDYVDSFEADFIDKGNNVNSLTVAKAFFRSAPSWVEYLFEFRNKLVALFGLKISGNVADKHKVLDNFNGEVGEQIGLFKVFDKTSKEIILGEDDKHLNFRVSLFIEQNAIGNKKLIISTTVHFNNWFGKLYFLPVRPFHKVIVPTMLKGIIKNLNTILQVE